LIKETDPIRPLSPYAASKLGQEAVARMFHEAFSIQTVVTRAFMHIGPGQPSSFATADWVEPVLRVGDIDLVREFMDVRDVVAAYADLVSEAAPGSVVNIASGSGHSLREALEILLGSAQVAMEVQVDPTRIRAADPLALIGDPTKIREIIDWQPRYSVEQSLSEILDYWRRQVAA
jgi:GDP-4-dehydro-6-deoxy-D-mannose reductase